MIEAYNSGKVVEGAYKFDVDGETITQVCTLAFIESTGVIFTGVSDAYNSNGEASINAFKFRIDYENTVTYASVTIQSSN